MKTDSGTIEVKAVNFANDAAAEAGEALIKAYNPPLTEEQQAAGTVILDALKLTEDGKLPKTEDLTKLQEKVDNIKTNSTFVTTIKSWVQAFVNFFRSSFSKKAQEELATATTQVAKEAVVLQQEAVEGLATPTSQSSVEAKPLDPIITSLTERSEQFLEQGKTSVLQPTPRVNMVPNIPLPPPPPPPSSPNMNPKTQTPPPQIGDLLRQIADGKKLKSAADRVLPDKGNVKDTGAGGVIDELAKALAKRNRNLGIDTKKVGGPSTKFIAEAAEFEKARKEEAERQARQDALDAPRIAAAIKKEQEEAAKLSTVKTPIMPAKPLVIGNDGIPLPPPPPPPSLNIKTPPLIATTVKKGPIVDKAKEKDNRQFAVDPDTLKTIQGSLRPVIRKETSTTHQPNVSGKKGKDPSSRST